MNKSDHKRDAALFLIHVCRKYTDHPQCTLALLLKTFYPWCYLSKIDEDGCIDDWNQIGELVTTLRYNRI